MNDALVEELLTELSETRKSFDKVAGSIKWNKINTAIQYVMIVVVSIVLVITAINYRNDQRAACERGNEFRLALDLHAAAIGTALVVVTDSDPVYIERYMEAYLVEKPDALELRDC